MVYFSILIVAHEIGKGFNPFELRECYVRIKKDISVDIEVAALAPARIIEGRGTVAVNTKFQRKIVNTHGVPARIMSRRATDLTGCPLLPNENEQQLVIGFKRKITNTTSTKNKKPRFEPIAGPSEIQRKRAHAAMNVVNRNGLPAPMTINFLRLNPRKSKKAKPPPLPPIIQKRFVPRQIGVNFNLLEFDDKDK